MIRAHRRRHRLIFLGAALIAPAILIASLSIRRAPPIVAPLPPALQDSEQALAAWEPASEARATIAGTNLSVRVLRGSDGAFAIELRPDRPLRLPDVLVYWTATTPTEVLPADATLLGTMRGERPFRARLPQARATGAIDTPGALLFYTPAQGNGGRLIGGLGVPRAGEGGADE